MFFFFLGGGGEWKCLNLKRFGMDNMADSRLLWSMGCCKVLEEEYMVTRAARSC